MDELLHRKSLERQWPTQNEDVVTTRLAFSNNGGESFEDAGVALNTALDVTIPLAAPLNAGTWSNEVSTLAYDKYESNANARWKLLWHHYLLLNADRRFEHGWIACKSAATVEGLASVSEVKLFASVGYDTSNNTQDNAGSHSPLGGAPAIQLAQMRAPLQLGAKLELGQLGHGSQSN